MKKKVLSVVLAAICTMSLMTGCGDAKDSTEKGSAGGDSYTVGISQFAEHGSLDNCREGFIEGLKEEGVDASKVVIKDLLGTKTSTTSAIGDYMEKLYKDTFGIKLEQVFTPDSKTFFKLLNEGDFDIASSGWGPDYDDISSFFGVFLSDSANNNGHYKNPKYDELVKKAASEEDAKKRVELYKEAEKILVADDAGIMPSYYADINSFRKN